MIPLPLLTGETRQLPANVREISAVLRVIAVPVTQIVESAVDACYVQLAVAPCLARLTPARSAALRFAQSKEEALATCPAGSSGVGAR